jgi:hypothetical protein
LFCFEKSCFRVEATLLRVRGPLSVWVDSGVSTRSSFCALLSSEFRLRCLDFSPLLGLLALALAAACPLVISLPFCHGRYLVILRGLWYFFACE